jgi:hypothetical protein
VNFDIGEVLARAWEITWKHKVLWVFNMFPVLLSLLFIPVVFIPMFFIGPNSLMNQGFVDQPLYVSVFIGTNLLLTFLSIILYAAGAASASLGILRVEKGRERLLFRDLFQDGLEYFWRILGVTLLIGAVISVVFLLLFGCMMLVGMATMGLGMICLQPLFLLLYPALLIVYSLVEQSQAAVIADDMGVTEAISRGWALIKANFWRFVLISLGIYFGIFILSSIVMLPFMAPFFFLPMIMEGSQEGFESQMFGWVLLFLSMILLPILAILQGFSLTFMKSAFMIVYLHLTRSTALQPVVK